MKKINSQSLPAFAEWDFKTTKRFNFFLAEYETLPSYKKVLSTMIKFKEMYQPIRKSSTYVDPFGHLASINEERKLKRIQVYMNKKDIINTFDEIHGKRLVITSRGHKIFYHDYPLAKLRTRSWDGIWTVIMYDFPEKLRKFRNFIRRKLKESGFGSPQLSVLISPLPIDEGIQELIEGEKMEKFVWTLRARKVLGMENQEVARKAWPLDEINGLYKKLLKVLPKIKNVNNHKLLDNWKCYFLALNHADPYLPFELLPKDWMGEVCEKEFVKLGPAGFLRALLRQLT